ncbi:sensor domain-containing diguanylate cyclase [Bacillus marinisedimentorum]|uniref:sensor domain-containing diguanylate cyclase n=1 Tax=Bacillus marinisedimentorum TaxID=1821260 RepID=UPI000872AF3D|nr:diguanylate cyclase [Bacillus marinisedimentorum]
MIGLWTGILFILFAAGFFIAYELIMLKRHFYNQLKSSSDIVFRLQLKPEPKFIYIADAVHKTMGYSPEELKKDPYIIFNQVAPEYFNQLYDMIFNDKQKTDIRTFMWTRMDGEVCWLETHISRYYDRKGNVKGINGIARDVTEKVRNEQKLKKLSYFDSLTGLYNRNYFEEYLGKADEGVFPLGIVMCDINDLKVTNDQFGHHSGDEYLKNVARILKKIANGNALAFRTGGDEFILLYPAVRSATELEGNKLVLRGELEGYSYLGRPLKVSLGVSVAYNNVELAEKLKTADALMYKEKRRIKQDCIHVR